jgi:hypothetical protein
VPALRFFIARPTLADAFFEYFRAMIILPVAENNLRGWRWFPVELAVSILSASSRDERTSVAHRLMHSSTPLGR